MTSRHVTADGDAFSRPEVFIRYNDFAFFSDDDEVNCDFLKLLPRVL